METALASAEFAPRTAYLNTASHGLLPVRAAAAVRAAVEETAEGQIDLPRWFAVIERARAAFARLAGVAPERVAVGTSVAAHASLVAAALPSGAEVLVAEDDFSSLVDPFAMRPGLTLRSALLAELPHAVRPGTALVAVAAVQAADGRTADLAAIGAAARAHSARTLVDTIQAAGWLPLDHGGFDYTVCGTYKWLLCPRSTSFLTVPEDGGGLLPLQAGWIAGERPWESCYGPIGELAASARRFATCPAFLLTWERWPPSLWSRRSARRGSAPTTAHSLPASVRARWRSATARWPPTRRSPRSQASAPPSRRSGRRG